MDLVPIAFKCFQCFQLECIILVFMYRYTLIVCNISWFNLIVRIVINAIHY